jgi:three-Cys-motif partner protein
MPTRPPDDGDDFFDQMRPSSVKKADILVRFFKGWAGVLHKHVVFLLYIDLFAGPGSYKRDQNGAPATPENPLHSTPVRIIKAAAADPNFSKALVAIFNDKNAEHIRRLKEAVEALPERAKLQQAPQYFSEIVGDDIARELARSSPKPPAMFFIDPYGYVGLTRDLILSVLKEWGSDCVFFFNYNRINHALGQKKFDKHLNALFGKDRVARMHAEIDGFDDPVEREDYVLRNLAEALREIGGDYFLPFRFRANNGRTRQHVIFTSKSSRGYHVMKNAMAKESSTTQDEIPTYEFVEPGEPSLLEEVLPPRVFTWTIDKLRDDLKKRYSKLERRFIDIVEEDGVGRPYIEANYRIAILRLRESGAVELRKPDGSAPRAKTCPRETLVKFKI